jgi:hypothetical protein
VRIRVDPRKVQRVEMRDGTSYPVGRNGSVHISDPAHVREMDRHGDPGAGVGYVAPSLGFVEVGGKTCGCGFDAWPWQRTCPRCGTRL